MCISKLEEFQQTAHAIELIRRGMRNNIVCLMTGASTYAIRKLSREILGHNQKSGPLPEYRSVLKSAHGSAHASLFLNVMLRVNNGTPQISVEPFLRAFDHYRDLVTPLLRSDMLDINVCWVIARAYRSGLIERRKCRGCCSHFIFDPDFTHTHSCPSCSRPASGKRFTTRKQYMRELPCAVQLNA